MTKLRSSAQVLRATVLFMLLGGTGLVSLGACGGELAVTPSECDTLRGTSCTGSKGCSLVETSAKVEVCGPACPHQNTCLDGRKPLLGTHYRQPDESEDYIFRADVCICVP